jgi:putative Holliday junction resolvase
MGRLIALDYGLKRTGLAVTDPLKIIATALETVPTASLFDFLKNYIQREPVDAFIIGMPRSMDNSDSSLTPHVRKLRAELEKQFPHIPVYEEDERLTSIMAQQAMLLGGMKKQQRRQKGQTDKISAVLILQSFMARMHHTR